MDPISALKKRVWKAMASRMNLTHRLACGLDIAVLNYSDWLTLNEIFVEREYAALNEPMVRVCKQPGPWTIVDLGANCGYFSAYVCDLLHRSGVAEAVRFVLVEAAPTLAGELGARLPAQMSRFSFDVVQGLAGKRSGSAQLQLDYKDHGHHVAGQGISSSGVGTVECEYIDLDTLVDRNEQIACIKVDIEGSEFDLIRDYPELLARAQTMAVEFHEGSGDIDRSIQTVTDLGFPLVTLCKATPDTRTYVFTKLAPDGSH